MSDTAEPQLPEPTAAEALEQYDRLIATQDQRNSPGRMSRGCLS